MHPSQAAFLCDHYPAMPKDEARTTRRVLAAAPDPYGGSAGKPFQASSVGAAQL